MQRLLPAKLTHERFWCECIWMTDELVPPDGVNKDLIKRMVRRKDVKETFMRLCRNLKPTELESSCEQSGDTVFMLVQFTMANKEFYTWELWPCETCLPPECRSPIYHSD